jgi:DNA-binding beta-propeller fold protein YncE
MVYVADTNNYRVQMFTSSGAYITQWGSQGSGNGEFQQPAGVGVDASGNIYVVEYSNHRIQKFGHVPTRTNSTSWGRLKSLYR